MLLCFFMKTPSGSRPDKTRTYTYANINGSSFFPTKYVPRRYCMGDILFAFLPFASTLWPFQAKDIQNRSHNLFDYHV